MKFSLLILCVIITKILLSQNDNSYRNYEYEIITIGENKAYILEVTKDTFQTKFETIIAINSLVFRSVTGITDETLEKMYINADKNKNGLLSWPEIEVFQKMIVAKYKYFITDTVLSPDNFIKMGGGKCDDWSLMTAGLLRFWNYEPYIARFGRTKVIGHALCLVKTTEKIPSGYMYYEIENNPVLPSGNYIPIDYDVVGGLSAIDGRWKISHVYVPESMY
ncbi:MAG: hypothetical protein JXR58_04555 [Bacteroidales bacterium]|nr:hypothetical protein [Bacteroidales bacterium]